MRSFRPSRMFVFISCLTLLVTAVVVVLSAQQAAAPAVAIDPDDIGGVVTGPKGPEAGVWVIAETRDLGVRYIKIGRHRRCGPLRGAGSAGRRTTACGPAATDWSTARRRRAAGPPREHHRDAGADTGGRRRVLPGHLLVFDAERSPRRPRSSGARASRRTSRSRAGSGR